VAAGQALDHQPRSGVRPEKRRRDRLIALARRHPEWALGFEDEVWWSRLAHPALHAWAPPDRPLRLVAQTVAKADPDPKALACYGLLVRWWTDGPDAPPHEAAWLRFVDGRPVSAVTTPFLAWCCAQLTAAGKTALLLVWDNASWHLSKDVRQWIGAHNRRVKGTGRGVRLLVCPLPVKSPWLNPIEPKWVHGKRKVVEPARLLTARELAERVCAAFQCPYEPHLANLKSVA
jgi:transposase